MIIKIECFSEDAAKWVERNWPDNTIRQGKSVICMDISGDEMWFIQRNTHAYNVFLTRHDEHLVAEAMCRDIE